ncbi:hypothetical protein [Deinococcus kurensis]|uniref:hypothetical protein n=1 Tax=Deinococcus kurensis TaxID=2662757 RepID=UPI0012D2E521|nr:hypothetical protein [Deinococcus kurensis]
MTAPQTRTHLAAAQALPAVIQLDINMLLINSVEVLQALKEDRRLRLISVVRSMRRHSACEDVEAASPRAPVPLWSKLMISMPSQIESFFTGWQRVNRTTQTRSTMR